MVSDKQLEANRRNAQKSTGPRTAEGKDRVRLNAVKHGLRSETLDVLPNEDPEIFAAHVDAWRGDLNPTGEAQGYLARQVALFAWKVDRADRYEATVLTRDIVDAINSCDCDDDDSDALAGAAARASFDPSDEGERLRRYQASMHRAMLRTLDALAKMKRDDEKRGAICANEAILPTPNEANPLEAGRPAVDGSGGVGRPAPSEPAPAPNKPNSSSVPAPNKAISARARQLSCGSVGKRPQPPKHEVWPIDLDLLSPDAGAAGWLNVSCEKR